MTCHSFSTASFAIRRQHYYTVGMGALKLLVSTDLYVRMPLALVSALATQRDVVIHTLRCSQNGTNNSHLAQAKCTPKEPPPGLRVILGDAYLSHGLDRAMGVVGQSFRYNFAAKNWGDFGDQARKQGNAHVVCLQPKRLRAALQTCSRVESTIGYRFRDKKRLAVVLDHDDPSLKLAYKRQEWLGDAVLELLIAEYWHTRMSGKTIPMKEYHISKCNQFFGLLTIILGVSQDDILDKKFSDLLDLTDISETQWQDSEILPSLNGRLDLTTPGAILPYLRRRASVDRDNGSDPIWRKKPLPKSHGDIFESLIGAVFHDSGFSYEVTRRVFAGMAHEILDTLGTDGMGKHSV